MVLNPLLASVHQFYSPSSLVITRISFNEPSRSSSTSESVINWIRWTHGQKQFSLIKTRPTRNPQSQQKQELRQSSSIIFSSLQILWRNCRFSNSLCEFFRDQIFRPSCAKFSHLNFPAFPVSEEPLNQFNFHFSGVSCRVTYNA